MRHEVRALDPERVEQAGNVLSPVSSCRSRLQDEWRAPSHADRGQQRYGHGRAPLRAAPTFRRFHHIRGAGQLLVLGRRPLRTGSCHSYRRSDSKACWKRLHICGGRHRHPSLRPGTAFGNSTAASIAICHGVPTNGGHSVGCQLNNAKAERKRTTLLSGWMSQSCPFCGYLCGSGSQGAFPSRENIPRLPSVPKPSTTFLGRQVFRQRSTLALFS